MRHAASCAAVRVLDLQRASYVDVVVTLIVLITRYLGNITINFNLLYTYSAIFASFKLQLFCPDILFEIFSLYDHKCLIFYLSDNFISHLK